MAVNVSSMFGLKNLGLPKDDDVIVPDHDDPLAQHNLPPSPRQGSAPSDTFHGPIPGIRQPGKSGDGPCKPNCSHGTVCLNLQQKWQCLCEHTFMPPDSDGRCDTETYPGHDIPRKRPDDHPASNGRNNAPSNTFHGPIPGIGQPGFGGQPDGNQNMMAPTGRPDKLPSDTFHGSIPGLGPLDNNFPSDPEDNPDNSKSGELDNATSDTLHESLNKPDSSFRSGPGTHPNDKFDGEGLCKPTCSYDMVCHKIKNKYQCLCDHTFQPPNTDGACDPHPPGGADNNNTGVVHPHLLDKIVNGSKTGTTSSSPIKREPDWRVLKIALPVGVFLFLFFVVILLFMRKWRHSRNSKRGSDGVVKNSDNVQLLERMNIISKNPTYFTSLQDGAEGKVLYVREIPLEHLQLVDVVGEGAFGQVFKGNLFNSETNCESKVAVKVLKEGVCNEIREDFEREVEIMSAFDHDNILRLIGVVTQNVGESPYMVFEYMEYGDLAELLRKNDPILRKTDDCIVLQKNDLIDISTQIAKGMAYLTSQHFVHRDLATRNCLVGEGLVVKISDFGMSRDIYTCDYYKIGGSRMLPVRWMSPESVKYGRFTSESDVWAYGVVLWEIFSCGRQPYYGHSNEEVIRFLDEKIYLQRPEDCPNVVYNVMIGCWSQEPKERFTFEKIQNLLEEYSKKVVLTDAERKSIDAASITEVIT